MFFIINKSKIYSYIIALSTVLVLFVAAAKINDIVSPANTIETSTNISENNIKQNEILNQEKDITKNIALSE